MENVRNDTSHQRKRASGSLLWDKSLHERSPSTTCASKNRQHHNHEPHIKDGLNEIKEFVSDNSRPLGVLFELQHNPDGRAPTRGPEHTSRPRVESVSGLQHLEAEQNNLPSHNKKCMWNPEVDLFADRTNAQLQNYISWKADPTAVAADAFTVSWRNKYSYAFPPFCLINRCLTEVQDQTQMIIITPMWQGQPWYASLLQMSTTDPILLPNLPHLLTGPTGDYHPLVQAGAMSLAAWKVSGRMPEIQHYQQQLNPCWRQNCPMELGKLTKAPGRGGVAGVINGCWIQFQPLWKMWSTSWLEDN